LPNIIDIEISQEQIIPTFDKQTNILRRCHTLEDKSETICRFYALYELHKFYKSAKEKELKTFDLMKPIKFIVSWNGVFFNAYFLKRILKEKSKGKGDFAFYIKNGLYILVPQIEKTIQRKKKPIGRSKETERFEPIDLFKTFNTIEFFEKGFFKLPSLFLSVPMYD
jgi:hypothetical protein